jgi:hypothetical protein
LLELRSGTMRSGVASAGDPNIADALKNSRTRSRVRETIASSSSKKENNQVFCEVSEDQSAIELSKGRRTHFLGSKNDGWHWP